MKKIDRSAKCASVVGAQVLARVAGGGVSIGGGVAVTGIIGGTGFGVEGAVAVGWGVQLDQGVAFGWG